MSFYNLKKRIKKNEGYSKKPYKDQLNFYTIGYGHLIKKSEKIYFNKSFKKKHFDNVFSSDFERAVEEYKNIFFKENHTKSEKELLIEMIFQLGSKGVVKFRKMLFFLNKKQKYMAALEMLDSLWYQQTPQRVKNLIKNYL